MTGEEARAPAVNARMSQNGKAIPNKQLMPAGYPPLGRHIAGGEPAERPCRSAVLRVRAWARTCKEAVMDKDRMKGSASTVKGKAKEALGRATGDSKMQGEGKMDRAKGKVQNAAGGIKDALKK